MSAPGEDEHPRRVLDALREMDRTPSRRRRPGFAVLGAVAAVGAVALIIEIRMRRQTIDLWPAAVALLGLAAICFVLYRNPGRRAPVSDVPTGVPPDRLFPVELLARGGWLRQFLEPRADGHLVVADDELWLRYRRPEMNRFLSLALACVFAFAFTELSRQSGLGVPPHLAMTGAIIFVALHSWSSTRRHDLRFPWSRVHSVSVGETRFHIRVNDDDYPEGFLVRVPVKYRKPLAGLFSTRTLFHDEEANLARSIRESRLPGA